MSKISRNLLLALAPLALAAHAGANENQEAVDEAGAIEGAAPAAAVNPSIVVEGEPDRTVCKRFAPPTSSKISRKKKICKLQSEWDYERKELARQNREIMDGQMSNTRTSLSDAFNSSSGRDRASTTSPQ